MAEDYKGYRLNSPMDAPPWGGTESRLFKMIIDKKIENSEKAVAGGVATLGADGLVPSSQLPEEGDLSSKIDVSEKGTAGGVATLGADGLVPSSQLPDGVDISGKIDVSEKGTADGVATLGADGLVPSSQLPEEGDLSSKIDVSEKGTAGGVATLGADGLVPSSQLPDGGDLSSKIDVSEKGTAGGVATLGADGLVPSSQLPDGGGLTAVATDATLSGDGSADSPLSVVASGGTPVVSVKTTTMLWCQGSITNGTQRIMDIFGVSNNNFVPFYISDVNGVNLLKLKVILQDSNILWDGSVSFCVYAVPLHGVDGEVDACDKNWVIANGTKLGESLSHSVVGEGSQAYNRTLVRSFSGVSYPSKCGLFVVIDNSNFSGSDWVAWIDYTSI